MASVLSILKDDRNMLLMLNQSVIFTGNNPDSCIRLLIEISESFCVKFLWWYSNL